MSELTHYERLLSALDATAKKFHPEYGPCDAIADGFSCAECERVFNAPQPEVLALIEAVQAYRVCDQTECGDMYRKVIAAHDALKAALGVDNARPE